VTRRAPRGPARLRIATDPSSRRTGVGRVHRPDVGHPPRRYRHALWLVLADGSEPARPITIGAKHDRHARFSTDGRWLAFLSDRRLVTEDAPDASDDREDGDQIHLLPLNGGEAHRLTDLPRGVSDFAWSPDGTQLAALSSSRGATREEDARRRGKRPNPDPASPPPSDYRFTDRLSYAGNGTGFTSGRESSLWLVDAADGRPAASSAGTARSARRRGRPMGRGSPMRWTAARIGTDVARPGLRRRRGDERRDPHHRRRPYDL
jgi:dipeptidyl aminopeptidase/acylaminoacyl peptidase